LTTIQSLITKKIHLGGLRDRRSSGSNEEPSSERTSPSQVAGTPGSGAGVGARVGGSGAWYSGVGARVGGSGAWYSGVSVVANICRRRTSSSPPRVRLASAWLASRLLGEGAGEPLIVAAKSFDGKLSAPSLERGRFSDGRLKAGAGRITSSILNWLAARARTAAVSYSHNSAAGLKPDCPKRRQRSNAHRQRCGLEHVKFLQGKPVEKPVDQLRAGS